MDVREIVALRAHLDVTEQQGARAITVDTAALRATFAWLDQANAKVQELYDALAVADARAVRIRIETTVEGVALLAREKRAWDQELVKLEFENAALRRQLRDKDTT